MSEHQNSEREELPSFNIKAWYGVMGFCIIGLSMLGFVSNDVSVRVYVMWAIILICLAPELSMMMTAYINAIKVIELLKHEDIKRRAAERKKRQQEAAAEQ